jgi:hypothetical protein
VSWKAYFSSFYFFIIPFHLHFKDDFYSFRWGSCNILNHSKWNIDDEDLNKWSVIGQGWVMGSSTLISSYGWSPLWLQHKIGSKTLLLLLTSLPTSNNIKCQVQLLPEIIIIFIVSVEGEWLENVQLANVFTTSCKKCVVKNVPSQFFKTCLHLECLKTSQKI